MMLCVSLVNYSVLVNFEKVGPIYPGRGLRQGDPLSPYLFILVTEGLTALIKHSVARGELHGVKICRGAPSVSHLLFADDCFLFCRSNLDETNQLMRILKIYEEASGQEINLAKSEVFFSRNLSTAAQEDLSRITGVRHVLGSGKYLGLPSMIGRKKKEIFAYIKDRIWKRINAWRGRMLSRAGKEVMIKSVLQAIPSYIMSIYIIPSTTITEIERMVNSFWWSGGNNNTGIRWLAWDKLTTPKAMGGMGFRDFQAFNMAMVAKQGWRLLQNPDALVSRVLKARYFPKTSFINSKLGNNPSYAWKSLWMCREVLGKGCRWVVGDGRSVRVMADPWVRGGESWWVSSPQKEEVYDMTVNQLLVEGEKRWDVQKVKYLFNDEMVEKILSMNICQDVREDKLIWEGEKNGLYTVRAGYRSIMSEVWNKRSRNLNTNWSAIWNINAPPKTKHLIWRVCKGGIPTRNYLL
jgi:hypothetical protein